MPGGFAVGAAALRTFVETTGLEGTIATALSRASSGDLDAVAAAAKTIGEAMRFAPLPEDVRAELASRYEELARATGEEPATGRSPLERGRRGQRGRKPRGPAGELPLGARHRAGLRRGARLLGEPLCPARDELPSGSRRRARPGDGGDRPADGGRRGLRGDVHVQPRQRRSQHGGLERELRARHRGRERRGDAGRLSDQQGHGRSGTADGELEGRRVRAGRGRTRGRAGGGGGRSGKTSRASAASTSPRSSRSRGASSATSGATRTSSGRSRADSRCPTLSACSRRDP